MNENYRITLWRAAVITAVVAGATAFVGWLMRARYDASVNPIEQIRPSAWTSLGVGAMLIPVGFAAYAGLSYWYNRPESATAENRVIRTVILVVAGLVMATGGVLVALGDPLKDDHNRSIFWRGFSSGWVLFATVIIVEYIILNLATRYAGSDPARLRQLETDLAQTRGWLTANETARDVRDGHIDVLEAELASHGLPVLVRPVY